MKRICSVILTLVLLAVSLTAFADGGQRFHEQGTKWVDPVEYYELQDISGNDFQRDYDQGDIDFNRVIKAKGKKVFGLRLKPIAGATRVKQFLNIGYDDYTSGTIDYQDLYGVEGIPLHEAGFCVYLEESVSRSYSFTYHYQISEADEFSKYTDRGTGNASISISGLHIVSTESGIGLDYALTARVSESEQSSIGSQRANNTMRKPSGVDARLGKFIYFNGSRYLLVMLSATAKEVAAAASSEDLTPEEKEKMTNHPWARVYFIVEQIMVEDDEEAVVPLNADDKEELMFFVEDLMTWFKGEGDPLRLGEHLDEKEGAVVNTISTVLSLLLGAGLASVAGSTGAEIAAGLLETIIAGGTPPPLPPNLPNTPDLPNMQGRREEEEEGKDAPSPSTGGDDPSESDEVQIVTPPVPDAIVPDDVQVVPSVPNGFNPSDYRYGSEFLRVEPDGDIVMRSPATEKEVRFYAQGDDTWISDNAIPYTADDIARRLAYEAEHKDYVKDVADTKARSEQAFHDDWDAKVKREQYGSDEQKAFAEWREKQEAIEKRKDEQLKKLAEKHNVAPSEEAVRKAIQFEQTMNQIDARTHIEEVKAWGESVKYVEKVDKICDNTLYVMGKCVPGGDNVYKIYTLNRHMGASVMESGLKGGLREIYFKGLLKGAIKGGISVAQFQAAQCSKFINEKVGIGQPLGEYIVFAGGEGVTAAIDSISQGKSAKEVAIDVMGATWKKSQAFAVSKGLGALGKIPKVDKFFKDQNFNYSKQLFGGKTSIGIEGSVGTKSTFIAGTAKGLGYLGAYEKLNPFKNAPVIDPLDGPVGEGGVQDRLDDVSKTFWEMMKNVRQINRI